MPRRLTKRSIAPSVACAYCAGIDPARGRVLAAVGVSGCVILPRDPVPTGLMDRAVIPDMPDVRAPAGRPSQVMANDLARSFAQEPPGAFPLGPDGYIHYSHLALSGVAPTARLVPEIAGIAPNTSLLFGLCQEIGKLSPPDNDGVVTVASATAPGRPLLAQWPVDHGGAIGWPSGQLGVQAVGALLQPPADHLRRYKDLLATVLGAV